MLIKTTNYTLSTEWLKWKRLTVLTMSTGKDVEKETIPSTAGKGVYWSSHLDGYLTISTKAKHMQTSPHRNTILSYIWNRNVYICAPKHRDIAILYIVAQTENDTKIHQQNEFIYCDIVIQWNTINTYKQRLTNDVKQHEYSSETWCAFFWRYVIVNAAAAKSLQSCPTLCDPTRLPCPWDSPGKNTGVGCHFLLQL